MTAARLLDLQRTYLPTFRLRIGERVTANGKTRPASLSTFRVTARSAEVVAAFTDRYGGRPIAWEDPTSQDRWEARLPVSELAVLIPPGEALSQHWERWDSGGCTHRCDGATEQLSRSPCQCPADLDKRMSELDERRQPRWCRPCSRLSVLCPEVAVLGTGMLVTHSLIVAASLPGAVDVASALHARGEMVAGLLSVEKRKGRRQYPLLHLDLVGVSWHEIAGGQARPVLPSGAAVPPITTAPVAGEGSARAGVPAGTAVEFVDPSPAESSTGLADREPFGGEQAPATTATLRGQEGVLPGRCSDRTHRKLMAVLRGVGIESKDHGARLAFCERITGRRVESSRGLSEEEAMQVLAAVANGARP